MVQTRADNLTCSSPSHASPHNYECAQEFLLTSRKKFVSSSKRVDVCGWVFSHDSNNEHT